MTITITDESLLHQRRVSVCHSTMDFALGWDEWKNWTVGCAQFALCHWPAK